MSFGLNTFDADSNVRLTQDKKLCRVIYTTIAPSGNSGSVTLDLTGISNPSFIAMQLGSDAYYRHLAHNVSLDEGTGLLTWTAPSISNESKFNAYAQFISADTKIVVFGYG
jgi:hypothetical protein